MHELAVSQGLMAELDRIVLNEGARGVEKLVLKIGPLSGVEPDLLRAAFPIAAAGSVAEDAQLEIKTSPVVVRCSACGADSEAAPTRLICGACGTWQVRVVSGDEMLLTSVELIMTEEPALEGG